MDFDKSQEQLDQIIDQAYLALVQIETYAQLGIVLISVFLALLLARQKHPGQKNNLDALCKRYDIDNSHRSLHGALLDARILADVYLAMTGGQTSLGLDAEQAAVESREQHEIKRIETDLPLPLWHLDQAAQEANRDYIEFLAGQHDDPAWK